MLLCALALGVTEAAGQAYHGTIKPVLPLCARCQPAPGARVSHLQAVLDSRRWS